MGLPKMKVQASVALAMLAVTASYETEAALVSRLNGLAVYDTEANLTWLQDANYAVTSGHDADGLMNWGDAMSWVSTISINGVAGWRLPIGAGEPNSYGPDSELKFQQQQTELGNLFYNVLGGVARSRIGETHNANFNLFSNIQDDHPTRSGWYWSGTEILNSTAGGMNGAWLINFHDGAYNGAYADQLLFSWPVHDGDVGASPVPIPGALMLAGSALLGLLGMRRGQRKA